ncbi:MAG: hypothetical protein U5R06_04595 [candidate division KSB1 bacterium]|nr:hypothetical protein [candidate division KSB1 bacterium]
MSTGQMLLVLAALVTFSMVSMTINQSVITSTAASLETESIAMGKEIANSFVERACAKPFDAAVAWGQTVESADDFTSCGAGGGESFTWDYEQEKYIDNYSDADDFHSLENLPFFSERLGTFRISMDVYYVDPDNPDTKVGYNTNAKAVVAKVTSPFFNDNPDTGEPAVLTMSRVITYRFSN